MNRNGTVTAYAYDANNRLLSETVGDTVTTYTYDANGNTLTAGDKTYTYNDRGQQTGYSNGTTTASYAYNPSGLRKAKTVGGSTKYFVYNGMNIVYEYSESVADGVAYFYGLNRTHNSEGEIYVYNAHGDVVQLIKDNSVVASYTYDAFGNLTSQIGESDNPFLYCGEYFDAETQTYYLRARYYNPANGRFTQQDAWSFMDTSDPLSLNLYTYCCNNPVMYVDPSGHFGRLWLKKLAAKANLKNTAYNQYPRVYLLKMNYAASVVVDIRYTLSMKKAENNKTYIFKASARFGVPSELVGAIIFKEQFTQSIPDFIANADTTIRGDKHTHSTGLGAIFPGTARDAWGFVNDETELLENKVVLPESNAELQYMLTHDDEFNIRTICAVLIYKASLNGYKFKSAEDVSRLSLEDWKDAVEGYNGSRAYVDKVYEYLDDIGTILS